LYEFMIPLAACHKSTSAARPLEYNKAPERYVVGMLLAFISSTVIR
jgi:hypothetical protein